MSTENLTTFLTAAKADPSLSEKIHLACEAPGSDLAAVMVELGAEAGQPFTAEEFRQYVAQASNGELTDEALEGVAGGLTAKQFLINVLTMGLTADSWDNEP